MEIPQRWYVKRLLHEKKKCEEDNTEKGKLGELLHLMTFEGLSYYEFVKVSTNEYN